MITTALALAPGEEIRHIIRRHWFSLAVVGCVDIGVFLGFTAVIGVFDTYLFASSVLHLEGAHAVFASTYLVSLVGLLLWMHFFAVWTDHWLDAWVITNKRVVDIEQRGFFSRQVSSFPLERIQDVTYDTQGFIATWLRFGNVRIQTASITNDFIMYQVPDPDQVKERVMDVIAKRETPVTNL
jgi:membrane protein YdbS with pleckstrin-like domain